MKRPRPSSSSIRGLKPVARARSLASAQVLSTSPLAGAAVRCGRFVPGVFPAVRHSCAAPPGAARRCCRSARAHGWWPGPVVRDPTGGDLGRTVDQAGDAFDDVVDVGEIALVLAMIEQLQHTVFDDGAGKLDRRHVRAAPRAVHREKPQAGAGNAEQVAVAVGHQFVGFLLAAYSDSGWSTLSCTE